MPGLALRPTQDGELLYRPYERGDLELLSELVTSNDSMRRTGGALRADEVLGLLERYLEPDDPIIHAALAVFRQRDMTFVGSAMLSRGSEDGAPELGFIVHPRQRGQGHATSMAQFLIRLSQTSLDAPRAYARVERHHMASIRVLEKAGMTRRRACGEGLLLYSTI